MSEVIVTTCDLKQDYEVIGPVFYQISNKGIVGSKLATMKKQYKEQIRQQMQKGSLDSNRRADWGSLFLEWGVGQEDFQFAFYIATEEIKKMSKKMGADAVIGMRQDIDIDTNGFAFFYLQMYGTAVRFKEDNSDYDEIPEL